MEESSEETPPVVFISYSHDSDEHMEWAAQLASKFRQSGIEVRFDQWDQGPGDELVKFMEKSVAESDRVIMVCTEPYVRKVNEGEGGAGYEAMVVTGEIIADQATRKFIPVIRQAGGGNEVPRCVSTRHYINLNDDADHEAEWEKLIRDIHQSPKLIKPSLGKNPFKDEPGDGIQADVEVQVQDRVTFDPSNVFERATNIIQSDDANAWRKLVHESKATAAANLLDWRERRATDFPTEKRELPSYMLEAVANFSSVFALALAGVQSGDEKYSKQLGLIDWILDPPGWEIQGRTEINMLPELILFAYQALIGAAALQSEQPQLAFDLATAKIRKPWDPPGEVRPLFKTTEYIGWPKSLKGNCSTGSAFLHKMCNEWIWLHKAFDGEKEPEIAVDSYCLFLNVLDFISNANRCNKEVANLGEARGPLYVAVSEDNVKSRAYYLLLKSRGFISDLFEKNGLEQRHIESLWPRWIEKSNDWVREVCKSHRGDEVPHQNLHHDLKSSGENMIVE